MAVAGTRASEGDPADLVAAVLEEEARREAEQKARTGETVLPDDLLPGVGGNEMPTREIVRRGGVSTLGVLFGLNLVDEFDRTAVAVLGPDIQSTLGISDTLLAVTATIGGTLIVLASVPVGYLADRIRRMWVIGGISAILGAAMLATGLIRSAWQLAITRLAAGFGKGGHPAFNSVLADAYPIEGRGRVFAIFNAANPMGLLIGPALAGGVAALFGGGSGWRWAFIVLALPTLLLALMAVGLREPRRGQNEQQAVFGDQDVGLPDEAPPLSIAFARLKKIRSFYFMLAGLSVMGFGVFSYQIFFNLFLEEHFGLEALERGYITSLSAIGGLAGAVVGGVVADRKFRESPPKALLATSGLLALFALGPVALYMPNLPLLVVVAAIAQLGIMGAITGIIASIASVIPFRLRAQGYAMVGIYIFFFGAFTGAILTGGLSDAFGERTALTIVMPPSLMLGAAIMAIGSRYIRRDISLVVEELLEERDEQQRVSAGGEVPVLQVRNLDFSYGQVQVLFDVGIDVYRGEVLALLGTNGAGKSTLLRAVSGLALPDRGVIRLNGRTITYADAEHRVQMGIVQVPGGKAIFPTLTVAENLVAGAYRYIWETERVEQRTAEVLELFPVLSDRIEQRAGTLSGGEQQMLALAKALLLDPEILLIDELSLGLAPLVVQEILAIVEQLKARGITMVIVEQSVNVALSIADRAVFMEKGQVRFEGPAADLLERDDLVRAVFLSGQGG